MSPNLKRATTGTVQKINAFEIRAEIPLVQILSILIG